MMGLLEVNDGFMRHLEQRKLALSDWKAVSAFKSTTRSTTTFVSIGPSFQEPL